MFFRELANDQRRQLIDTTQVYEEYLATRDDLARRFVGRMFWKVVAEKEYLYRRVGSKIHRSLGPRSANTEEAYEAFERGKKAAQDREAALETRLAEMAPVNRALGLARVPRVVARIMRRLDEAGVLGQQVCVLGTNALYAYEAKAGVRFESGLLATGDVDFGLDARRRLKFAAKALPRGFLALLQAVDASFEMRRAGDFKAASKDGFLVELITRAPRNPLRQQPARRLGGAAEDMEAVEVPKLEWVVEAPRFDAVAIADDGLPCRIVATDPRWFAAHKLWLSTLSDRESIKRPRDAAQGKAVAALLARAFPHLPIADAALSQMPQHLREALREAWRAEGGGTKIEW